MNKTIVAKHLTLAYLGHVKAYLDKGIVNGCEPSEELMREVEIQIGIPEQGADDYRRMLFGLLGKLLWENKSFAWDFSPELTEAIWKLIGN